jgi:protein MpaA
MAPPRSSGRNRGGYHGDTIDIDALNESVLAEAERRGWSQEGFLAGEQRGLYALHRMTGSARARIYISAGIHGDEPAGPATVLELLRQDRWPADADVWLFPCLNPAGFRLNQRENALGFDLNRDYRRQHARETKAHVELLDRLPQFDLMICLHEDWEAHGFYLYELNPDGRPSPAEEMIRCVAEHCPVDLSELIDGRPAGSGIIRPELDPGDREEWPEAFYLILSKTRWSYTLEAPSDFDLGVRVAALGAAVNCLLAKV